MPLVGNKYLYVSMPKTGTNWAFEVLAKYAGGTRTLPDHAYVDHDGTIDKSLFCLRHIEALQTDKSVITTIREPIDWLRSFWEFRLRDGLAEWPPDIVIRRAVESAEFPYPYSFLCFVTILLDELPGWVSGIYAAYTKDADYVCCLDTIATDLAATLDLVGQDFDRERLVSYPPKHVTKDLPVIADIARTDIEHLLKDPVLRHLPDTMIECLQESEPQAFEIWERVKSGGLKWKECTGVTSVA